MSDRGERGQPAKLSSPPCGLNSVGESLRASARRAADSVAIEFADVHTTYAELDDAADRLAAGLIQRGIRPGDRVAVLMANRTEYMVAFYGIARAGAVVVPLVTQSTADELSYFLTQSGSRYLITDAERWAPLRALRHTLPFAALAGCAVIGLEPQDQDALANWGEPWAELIAKTPEPETPLPAVGLDDVSAFMYTSGSTGRPKAVVHTHRTVLLQVDAVSERLGYTAADRLMAVFPLFHGNALVWSAATAIHTGAALMLARRFSATRFWDDVRRHRVTAVNLLLGAINMLLAQPLADQDREHTLRLVLSTVTPAVHQAFAERFQVDVVTLWAFAESPLGTMVSPGYGYRDGLVGWPMGHETEIRVSDETGASLPPGEIGELQVRGPATMLRYHNAPEATARILRADGWIRSGDLGRLGDDGMFYFVGREKHVIRRAGENVSGEEVEERLTAHPEVAEAAVIAVPDPIRGEEVKAIIVPIPGTRPSESDLVRWVAATLSDFKVPRYIDYVDELPRTGPEKIDLPRLRREHSGTGCWDARTAHA